MATRLTIRLDFATGRRLGAGKVSLLEAIEQTGSISAAGRLHEAEVVDARAAAASHSWHTVAR